MSVDYSSYRVPKVTPILKHLRGLGFRRFLEQIWHPGPHVLFCWESGWIFLGGGVVGAGIIAGWIA